MRGMRIAVLVLALVVSGCVGGGALPLREAEVEPADMRPAVDLECGCELDKVCVPARGAYPAMCCHVIEETDRGCAAGVRQYLNCGDGGLVYTPCL